MIFHFLNSEKFDRFVHPCNNAHTSLLLIRCNKKKKKIKMKSILNGEHQHPCLLDFYEITKQNSFHEIAFLSFAYKISCVVASSKEWHTRMMGQRAVQHRGWSGRWSSKQLLAPVGPQAQKVNKLLGGAYDLPDIIQPCFYIVKMMIK